MNELISDALHVEDGGRYKPRGGGGGLKSRLFASGLHLGLSGVVACIILMVVYLGWYPEPLESVSGVGEILVLLLAVDVTLGPLLTLVVFNRRKKSLRFDLSCIALVQILALVYGILTVEAGRPHYLVFVKDRFEVVSKADLTPEDYAAAAGNPAAIVNWFSPRIVAAEMLSGSKERERLLFESVLGGRDIQHFPKQYRDYATHAGQAAARGLSIQELRLLNPDDGVALQLALESTGLPEKRLKFLPIKGPAGDAAMFIDASSGAIVGMAGLRPWR